MGRRTNVSFTQQRKRSLGLVQTGWQQQQQQPQWLFKWQFKSKWQFSSSSLIIIVWRASTATTTNRRTQYRHHRQRVRCIGSGLLSKLLSGCSCGRCSKRRWLASGRCCYGRAAAASRWLSYGRMAAQIKTEQIKLFLKMFHSRFFFVVDCQLKI
jgi:hypothetical protein